MRPSNQTSSIPSTVITPASCVFNWLIQRIIVVFLNPDGPQTTTFSPCRIVKLITVSARNGPKYLATWPNSIIAFASDKGCFFAINLA